MSVPRPDPLSQLSLPPGFRFYPTDEELLVQYLCRKVAGHQFSLQIIGEIDLYKYDPWVLPSKATFGEKEWYFFSPRDRKYPNGSRPNRVAGSGYWKATGTDKLITTEGRKVGIKKALVFYIGRAPKGTKTNWIMHEYRLTQHSRRTGSSKLDDWVLCRIYKKNSSAQNTMAMSDGGGSISSRECSKGVSSSSSSSHHIDEMLESLPEMDQRSVALPRMNSFIKALQQQQQEEGGEQEQKPFNLQSLGSGNFDWASLAAVSSLAEVATTQQTREQAHGAPNTSMYLNPFPPQMGRVEEEVQSGLRSTANQRDSGNGAAGFPGFLHPSQSGSNSGLTQTAGLTDSLDPFGFRYPSQLTNGFGFVRQ